MDSYFKMLQIKDSKKKEIQDLKELSDEYSLMIKAFSSRIEILEQEIEQTAENPESSMLSLQICLDNQSIENLMKILELTDDPATISLIQNKLHRKS